MSTDHVLTFCACIKVLILSIAFNNITKKLKCDIYWLTLIYKEETHPMRLKPIFHCDAKSFALGIFASPNAKDSTFVLPNVRITNMLVSLVLSDAILLRFTRRKT